MLFSSYILCINSTQKINNIKTKTYSCTSYKTLEEAEQNAKGEASYMIYPVIATNKLATVATDKEK